MRRLIDWWHQVTRSAPSEHSSADERGTGTGRQASASSSDETAPASTAAGGTAFVLAATEQESGTHVLVRGIDRSLWETEIRPEGRVTATLIQHRREVSAKKNELSFWRFDRTEAGWLEKAVLAIVGAKKSPDGVHLVWLDEASLSAAVKVSPSQGDTFESLKRYHVDATGLDGRGLVFVAESIAESLAERAVFKTREEVIDLLCKNRDLIGAVAQLPKALKDAIGERDASK